MWSVSPVPATTRQARREARSHDKAKQTPVARKEIGSEDARTHGTASPCSRADTTRRCAAPSPLPPPPPPLQQVSPPAPLSQQLRRRRRRRRRRKALSGSPPSAAAAATGGPGRPREEARGDAGDVGPRGSRWCCGSSRPSPPTSSGSGAPTASRSASSAASSRPTTPGSGTSSTGTASPFPCPHPPRRAAGLPCARARALRTSVLTRFVFEGLDRLDSMRNSTT